MMAGKKKTKISPKGSGSVKGSGIERIWNLEWAERAVEPAKVIKYKVEVLGPGGWFDGSIGDSFRSFDTLNEAYQYAETWDYETRVVEVEE